MNEQPLSDVKASDRETTMIEQQPISEIQLRQLVIEWVPHESVRPNRYNPNRMTEHDRALLRQSLLEDGWTQPIVTLPDRTIVDGEQRWTTAGLPLKVSDIDEIIEKMERRREQGYQISASIMTRLHESRKRLAVVEARGEYGTLAAVTGNLVPITRVDFGDEAHKMISTIRHNRARGTHVLDMMAEIAQDLKEMGLDFDDLETRLGMDEEEINRLLAQVELPELLEPTLPPPSSAWIPVHVTQLTPEEQAAQDITLSERTVNDATRMVRAQRARAEEVERQVQQRMEEAEGQGRVLTQAEKQQMRQVVEQEIPAIVESRPPEVRRLTFFVTIPEYEMCITILGDTPVRGLLDLCQKLYLERYGTLPEGIDVHARAIEVDPATVG
jgi:hypothetical protein